MKEFTMVFTTRHRNELEVENDCMLICDCITAYTPNFKYIYNGKDVVIFHVYDTDKKTRVGILALLLGHMHSVTDYKSIDLQSYTKE